MIATVQGRIFSISYLLRTFICAYPTAIPRRLALFCKAFIKPGHDPDSVSFLASRECFGNRYLDRRRHVENKAPNNATAVVCYLIVERLERLSTGWLPSTRTSLRPFATRTHFCAEMQLFSSFNPFFHSRYFLNEKWNFPS